MTLRLLDRRDSVLTEVKLAMWRLTRLRQINSLRTSSFPHPPVAIAQGVRVATVKCLPSRLAWTLSERSHGKNRL